MRPGPLPGLRLGAPPRATGFTLIEVGSYEEALDWVKQWPPIDGHGNVELELRQVFAAEDFGDAFTPELREREDAMRFTIESRSKS